ncbi:MAG: glucosamine-6-phosphate deaminase [Mucilaginibacter polytrichastri]|nr:glucosamine-6-phosphate deaminase [Mucilaginibacter polytrichastri]
MKLKNKLRKQIAPDRAALGRMAAGAVSMQIRKTGVKKAPLNMIFAAAPSQNEFLAALVADETIDWSRINAFHMDEYIGLPAGAPQLFSRFLSDRLFDRVPFRAVHLLDGNAADLQQECARYAALLEENPPDIVCMGIGENTHLAFNDPHVADFDDPQRVKIVELDDACRQQQVNDACFTTKNQVPTHALTLSIPALMRAPAVFCMVPGSNKAQAVAHTLNQPVSAVYPSTILRTHEQALLFLDTDSAALLHDK